MTASVTMARRNVIVAQPISATHIAASGLRHLPGRTRAMPPRSRQLGCVVSPYALAWPVMLIRSGGLATPSRRWCRRTRRASAALRTLHFKRDTP